MKKTPWFYIVLTVASVLAFIGTIAIPETGNLSLINEVMGIFVMIPVAAMLIKGLIVLIKCKKLSGTVFVVIAALLVGFVICSKSVNIVKDIVSGPQWITISECAVERRGTSNGIFSLSYYLKGDDSDGESHRFRISGKEYEAFKNMNEISVLCYKNTGRIVDIKKVSGTYE